MSDTVLVRPLSPERNFDRRWVAASLLFHAGLLAALLLLVAPLPPAEVKPLTIRVVMDRPGSAGAAGGGGGSGEEAGTPAQSAPPADSAAASATPEPPEPPTPPQEIRPPPQPVQQAVVPPQPTPAPTVAVVQQPPPPPRPEKKPVRVTHAAPEPKVAETAPPPAPPAPPIEQPAPTPAPSAAPGATASAAPGSGLGPGGTAGHGQGNEGHGFGALGNGEGPGDDYLAALQRWIQRYKKYPDNSLKKKEEGQVMVGFTLARDGTVLDAWIEHSSGIPALDEATLAMMHRASPVPPVPDRYKGENLSLSMPIDYHLGTFERLFR